MSACEQTHRHRVLDAPLARGMTSQRVSILQKIERGVEDVAGFLVAPGLHPLHPFFPDWLAGELAPTGELIRRDRVTLDAVVAGLDLLEHALLGGVEEILAPEFRARETADAHDLVAHVLGQAL